MTDERPDYPSIARRLDMMERSVSSWEASFLESVLKRIDRSQDLSTEQAKSLLRMFRRYFPDEAALELKDGEGDGEEPLDIRGEEEETDEDD
jgi:hypothetical protein